MYVVLFLFMYVWICISHLLWELNQNIGKVKQSLCNVNIWNTDCSLILTGFNIDFAEWIPEFSNFSLKSYSESMIGSLSVVFLDWPKSLPK